MLGAMIAKGELDVLIFFWDPMSAQPHDVDVKALLRMSVLYNILTACNRSTADFLISSPSFNTVYDQKVKDYGNYIRRLVKAGYRREMSLLDYGCGSGMLLKHFRRQK